MGAAHSWRARLRRCSIGLIASDPHSAALSWVGVDRIAISGLPPRGAVPRLADQGVTHVVNCRARPQVLLSGDLAAERAAFGHGRVAHAPMWPVRGDAVPEPATPAAGASGQAADPPVAAGAAADALPVVSGAAYNAR